jgi:unsaturated rhamnogalacturonyl hydrolase
MRLVFLFFTIVSIAFSEIGCNSSTNSNNDAKINYSDISIRMADSEMKRNPDPRLIDFRSAPKWEYTNGLLCMAMLKVWKETNDQKYLDYVRQYTDSMISEDGKILTYNIEDYNIDRVNSGKVLLELYKKFPEQKYKMAIETLRDQMRNHPRTSEGGFWHKKVYPSQMWLDGLYMGSPFLAQYALEFNEPALFDDVANQFHLVDIHLYDTEKQLYYHGWDESHEQQWANDTTGLSPHFWGRAMGWFAMAIVDVLDFMPENHPQRPEIIAIANKVAVGIKRYQDQESGLWYQVLDLGEKEGNYLESSCSSMFTYFLLKSLDKGYIDSSYSAVAQRGYEGILNRFIKSNTDGTVSLTNVCAVAGLGGDPYRDASFEYYVGEPQRDNDPKGTGPFIMTAILASKTK